MWFGSICCSGLGMGAGGPTWSSNSTVKEPKFAGLISSRLSDMLDDTICLAMVLSVKSTPSGWERSERMPELEEVFKGREHGQYRPWFQGNRGRYHPPVFHNFICVICLGSGLKHASFFPWSRSDKPWWRQMRRLRWPLRIEMYTLITTILQA